MLPYALLVHCAIYLQAFDAAAHYYHLSHDFVSVIHFALLFMQLLVVCNCDKL